MSETPKISDHAIQAAAEAYQDSYGSLKQRIQAALEAASRHLKADAWDEGWNDGAGWPQQDINPYRKASA